jgi:hypothetical protein
MDSSKISPQWLAGFFDGEGCISVRAKSGNAAPSIRVDIAQSDFTILAAIGELFPGGLPSVQAYPLKDKKRYTCGARLTWNGYKAKPILEYMKDYVLIKKVQVDLALQFLSYPPHTVGVEEEKLEIHRKLREANTKTYYDLPEGGVPWQ